MYENAKKVLYMEIFMAMYRCIESALRWYELYPETLEKEGFTINAYDNCVENKMMNGKRCTIDPKVMDGVINMTRKHFGDLMTTRGGRYTIF